MLGYGTMEYRPKQDKLSLTSHAKRFRGTGGDSNSSAFECIKPSLIRQAHSIVRIAANIVWPGLSRTRPYLNTTSPQIQHRYAGISAASELYITGKLSLAQSLGRPETLL